MRLMTITGIEVIANTIGEPVSSGTTYAGTIFGIRVLT